MKELKNEFFTYLEEKKAAALAEADKLKADDRVDESILYKAKANIYDIFKPFFNVSEQRAKDNGMFNELFHKSAENVIMSWNKSYDVAKEHNDAAKVVMEEAKLAAAKEAEEKFDELFAKYVK